MAKKALKKIIQSLTKSEKRNFKLFAGFSGKDSRYLKLFEAMVKNPFIDEKTLTKDLGISRSELRKQKTYLFENLLKSFHFFGKGEADQLANFMANIRILIRRRVFDEAALKLAKARSIALSQEWFAEAISLRRLEKSLPLSYQTVSKSEWEVQTLRKKLENLEELEAIHAQLETGAFQWTQAGPTLSLPEAVLKRSLVNDPRLALSIRARLEQLIISRICHVYLENLEQAAQASKQILQLFEENDHLFSGNGEETHLHESSNLTRILFITRQQDAFLHALLRLKNRPVPPYLEALKNEQVLTTLFGYSLETGKIELASPDLDQLESFLDKWSEDILPRKQIRFLYHGALLHLIAGEPTRALRLLNQCLRFPESTPSRLDYRGYARVLQLIVLWELGDFDWLEHTASSALRYWKNKGESGLYPCAVIKIIAKAPSILDPESRWFKDQWKQQQSRRLSQVEERIENDLRFLPWLESKANGISIAQVLKSQYLQGNNPETQQESG